MCAVVVRLGRSSLPFLRPQSRKTLRELAWTGAGCLRLALAPLENLPLGGQVLPPPVNDCQMLIVGWRDSPTLRRIEGPTLRRPIRFKAPDRLLAFLQSL